jgi:hypothetical protein
MKQPGNGSSRFKVGAHDMGGWARVIASGPPTDDLGKHLSHTLTGWFRQHPQLRLVCVAPITRDGTTIELRGWYECHWFPPTAEAPRPIE